MIFSSLFHRSEQQAPAAQTTERRLRATAAAVSDLLAEVSPDLSDHERRAFFSELVRLAPESAPLPLGAPVSNERVHAHERALRTETTVIAELTRGSMWTLQPPPNETARAVA